MAGKASFASIDVVDLTRILGGLDKQTAAAQLAIAQATSAIEGVAKAAAPKDSSTAMVLELMGRRRSGGPSSAPAATPDGR